MRRLLLSAILALGLGAFALTGQAGVVTQSQNANYVAFEAEHADSLGGGTRWRVIDLTTPYNHPNPNGFTPVLLPPGSNASRGGAILTDFVGSGDGTVVFKIDFQTAGTYRWYVRDGAYEDGNDTSNYGNEDSMFRPTAFDAAPTTTYHGYSGATEGAYDWRNTGFNYTAAAPGVVEFRIGNRESGFSIDRMVFSQTTNLSDAALDALFNSALDETHFTDADGGDSNWSTAGNWDNGVPTTLKSAFIGNGNTANLSASGAAAFQLSIGHAEATLPGNGTLNQSGGDLTVVDGMFLGSNPGGSAHVAGTYTATGGSLTVGQPATGRADLYLGYNTAGTDYDATGTLDLSGATQFDAYLRRLSLGEVTVSGSQDGSGQGILKLPALSNIDAQEIMVSWSSMFGTVQPTSTIELGTTTNIKTDSFTVGGFRGMALVEFASGGTLTLAGSSGAEADLLIADCNPTNYAADGHMDMSGGTFNATLDQLLIGYDAGGPNNGGSVGKLTFNAGTVTANSLTLGDAGSDGRGNGTLDMGGGSLTVNGNATLGTGTAVSQGTINQTGGTIHVTGDVTGGVGTSTIHVDGGSLDVDGSLAVDNLRVGYNGRTASVTVGTGGVGTATVGASGDLYIGRRTSNLPAHTVGTLDVSATSSFTADLDSLVLASLTNGSGGGDVDGTLILGPDNTINADTVVLGYIDGGNVQPVVGTIQLGASNTINADTFIVGAHKGTGDVHFTAGGTFELSGNTGAKTDLRIGDNSDSTTSSTASGDMDLSGGTFIANLGQLVLGDYASDVGGTPTGSGSGIGSLTLGTSASNNVQVDSVLLANYNSNATTGSGSKIVSGTITMGGGTFQVAGDLVRGVNNGVANGVTATSTVNVDGGAMTIGGDFKVDHLRVGYEGKTGSLTVTGGDVEVGSAANPTDLYVGRNPSNSIASHARGTLDLSGANSFQAWLDDFIIGERLVGGGSDGKGVGTVILSPDNTIDANRILISRSEHYGSNVPQSTLTFGAANDVTTQSLTVGEGRGHGYADIVSGGVLNLTGPGGGEADLFIANSIQGTTNTSSGEMDLSGGEFNATLDQLLIAHRVYRTDFTVTTPGTLTYEAGTVTANSATIGSGTANSAGDEGGGLGTLNLSGTAVLDVAGPIQLGIGTSVSQGTINLSGGKLKAASISGGAGTHAFNWTGGRLAVDDFGFDLVQDNTDSQSRLAPGDSVGTTDIAGNYTQNAGLLEIEIESLTSFDLVNVSGDAELHGGVEVLLLGGYTPQTGDTFDVLVAGGSLTLDPNFAVIQPTGGLSPANYFTASVVGGNTLQLSLAVPEPSTLALAGLALAALVGLVPRRRRRR